MMVSETARVGEGPTAPLAPAAFGVYLSRCPPTMEGCASSSKVGTTGTGRGLLAPVTPIRRSSSACGRRTRTRWKIMNQTHAQMESGGIPSPSLIALEKVRTTRLYRRRSH